MGEIAKPTRTTFYIAYGPDGTTHTGFTESGQVTTTGQPSLEYSADENDYLGILGSVADKFPLLPEAGVALKAGEIYVWNSGAVMVRQDHLRTIYDPDQTPALFIVHRINNSIDWIVGEQVYVGTQRGYSGILYEAVQAHVTQSDWTPPAVPALWKVVVQGGGGSTWVDTGATVTGQAGQLFYVSVDISTLGLTTGQAIRFGNTLETTYVSTWAGTTNLMQINPPVAAKTGDKVWKWA